MSFISILIVSTSTYQENQSFQKKKWSYIFGLHIFLCSNAYIPLLIQLDSRLLYEVYLKSNEIVSVKLFMYNSTSPYEIITFKIVPLATIPKMFPIIIAVLVVFRWNCIQLIHYGFLNDTHSIKCHPLGTKNYSSTWKKIIIVRQIKRIGGLSHTRNAFLHQTLCYRVRCDKVYCRDTAFKFSAMFDALEPFS